MMRLFLVLFTLFAGLQMTAQVLEPVDDLGGLGGLFEDEGKISEVRVLGETDETLNIEVKLEGFDKTKEYRISGEILNASKRKIKIIPSVKRTLSKGQKSIDLGYEYKRTRTRSTTSKPYITTGFVRINVSEKDDLFGDFDIEGIGGVTKTYRYKKEWKINDCTNCDIEVTLTPIGAARTTRN